MSIFSKQKAFCRACGKEMKTDFRQWGGEVCNRNCFKELEWRKCLSILGKEYKPDPKSGTYMDDYGDK